MLYLITYDVETVSPAGRKRLRQVAKLCQNYGQRVQNSVFECLLDEVSLIRLKHAISEIIDKTADSVRFYNLGKNWNRRVDMIGRITSFNMEEELII
ncbi:MAG: CRISPR-associated endonuclease Cas2 [Prevotella sp.]|nr:CRISPR-associated endonuclease Cas2 [Prevotella sp.]